MQDPKKGASVKAEYEATEGDQEGKKVTQYYKLTDMAGNKAPGMAYLKRDLGLLGHEDVSGAKLKKVLAEISEEQPMVTINVKQNGQYTNAYIQGLAEDGGDSGLGDGDEASSSEIEVGDRVTFEDDGTKIEGEVIKIKDDVATVKDDDDDKHKVDLDDLTKVNADADPEPEPEAEEIEVGSRVKFTNDDGDEVEGEVTKINTKKGTATVEDDDADDHTVDLDDLSLVSEGKGSDDDDDEIAEGDDVTWKDDDDDEHTGTVKKIKDDVATVVDDDTDKKVKVDVSDLTKA